VVSATLQLQISSVIADATPEPGMLKDLFTLATRRFRTHFIVIDGWDECTTSDQRDVMDVLGRVAADTLPSHLKVVIASCDNIIKDVPRSFSSRYSLTISRKHVDTDIAAFIDDTLRAKIDCGELLVGDPKLVADVQRALVDGADGM
jgi:archaellum biogenesis ATPase FlaH